VKMIRQARSLFGGTDIWRHSEWVLGLVMFLTNCFSISVTPFLRKDMGERYFGWVNLYFGYSVLSSFLFLGPFANLLIHGPVIFPQLMPAFMLAFIGASIYQKREIAKKNSRGVEWHTMYVGTSILPLPLSQEKILKFVEPVLVYLAGHFLWNLNWEVGMWLYIAAFSLAINNHIVYYNERQTLLDMRDGQIEATYLSGAMAGKPPQETAGLVVAESTRKLFGQNAKLKDAFSNLPNELKDLLDSEPEVKGAV
jgi:hypothetical protein